MTDGVERALASKLVVREKLRPGRIFECRCRHLFIAFQFDWRWIWTIFDRAGFVYGIFMMVVGLFFFVVLNKSRKEDKNRYIFYFYRHRSPLAPVASVSCASPQRQNQVRCGELSHENKNMLQ